MSEMRDILLDQTGRLLSSTCSDAVLATAAAGTWPEAMWAALDEAGLPLTLVAAEAGGVGADLGDAIALVRLCARHGAPVPVGDTIVTNWLWCRAGGDPLPGPGTLSGEARALVLGGAAGAVLEGAVEHVGWSAAADLLVVAQATEGPRLVLIPAGLGAVTPGRNLADEPRDRIRFEAVTLPADRVRPMPNEFGPEALEEFGALLRCGQMVGAMETVLELSMAHVNTRSQFGRPLAKFQTVQNQLAVAVTQVAAAAAALDAAVDAPARGFRFAVAAAKVCVGEAAGAVAATAHQVHGAMGFSAEYALQRYTRRLWAWRDEFGSEAVWRRRLGYAVLRAPDGLWAALTGTPGRTIQ